MARRSKRLRRLWDTYSFEGFRAEPVVRGVFGDPKVRIVTLKRRSKKHRVGDVEGRRGDSRRCGKVKQERLDFLADNPFYTKRFACFVGRRCRQASISDVAKELALDWHTIKALEMQYMKAQLARAGTPGPLVIGIDEIAIRKGQSYRIVVSDLVRRGPIWFGGADRSEASMAQFYAFLGKKKSARIRLAVMDMWKPFRVATT